MHISEPSAVNPRLAHAGRVLLVGFELIAVALLAVLVLLALVGLGLAVPGAVTAGASSVIEHVLTVFVLLELFATAIAYLSGGDVLRRLLETVFVAIVRKLISMHVTLESGLAVASLLVAASIAWALVVVPKRD